MNRRDDPGNSGSEVQSVMKISVCIPILASTLYYSTGGRRISVRELSLTLGVSLATAGRILARMSKLGLAIKLSRGRYIILPPSSLNIDTNTVICNGNPEN